MENCHKKGETKSFQLHSVKGSFSDVEGAHSLSLPHNLAMQVTNNLLTDWKTVQYVEHRIQRKKNKSFLSTQISSALLAAVLEQHLPIGAAFPIYSFRYGSHNIGTENYTFIFYFFPHIEVNWVNAQLYAGVLSLDQLVAYHSLPCMFLLY